MSFLFLPYNDAQIKQRTNAKMLYASYVDALNNYNLRFRYKMLWQKHKDGYELLAKQHLKSGKREYLGRRSQEMEHIRLDFENSKLKVKERLSALKQKLNKEEKLNKIEGITRTPKELIAIFAKINELGLDNKVIAIGTNALFAYEARCGVAIEQEHLATRDIDLLNRKDKGISFIFNEIMTTKNAHELLQSIDSSFEKSKEASYRFINNDGVWIELINPMSDSVKQESFKDNLFEDVMPLAMKGMQWLENSRLFKELIVGDNGKCAFMTTVHPLEFSIYKNWLSSQEDRDYIKHTRDMQQSKLVTRLIQEHMPNIDIKEDIKTIRHFKKELIENYMNTIFKESN
ncbi:MAG: GSU2403 family nucleotidyltransferase fold protein [Sulfurimonas sp.]|nr:GSU2403 family nucleotidyltransferase fold protein [Sulfurimonas sp.]